VTPDRWQTEFKVLDQIQNRNGNLSTRQTMVVERGSARLQTA
jgi:alkaline phosphatase D